MINDPLPAPIDTSLRDCAYTTPRPDVLAMVPSGSQHILDVGCSSGALGRSLKLERPDRVVFGIEFDLLFAQEAKAHLDHVLHADLNQLNWLEAMAGHKFDCIIFADVLEHLIDPKRCLLQARQHLTPEGCIVVSLPNIRHLSAMRAIFVKGCFPQNDRGIFDRTHLHWFTVGDAKQLLHDCGFKTNSMSFALRWGDRGGGRLNRILNRLPTTMTRWAPVREFLTYQMSLRAEEAR
jgi:SAM-dependent methyltransferase